MKAARLHEYHQPLKLEEVDEPKAVGPFDVVVKIGAAGLCRTDLHIQEGQWAEKSEVDHTTLGQAMPLLGGTTPMVEDEPAADINSEGGQEPEAA